MSLNNGSKFPFTVVQIDQVIERYHNLKGVPPSSSWHGVGADVCEYSALQAEGKEIVPALAWLMGAVMPLDAREDSHTDQTLQESMEQLRF